ncbi:MAG TPA: LacI family DNA-binding transcriptional regulator [Candidatus Sulfotelmatobacter sp.]|jgi:LacI family transcriptional regulator|nr:LacI family DNA-binding transcriptional regulator [Candidatus Sulfotelmatobacter sp.]
MGQTKKPGQKPAVITLKAVAQHIGLTPGTVSAVLNDSPSARSIPQDTKNRIHAAAKELDYRPNFFARTLRNKRTYTIGVIAEEIGDSYSSPIISGIEQYLRKRDYFFLTVVHRHDPELLERYSHILSERGVEGIITVDTTVQETPALPTVAIAGHKKVKGVTNIVLDHERAAVLSLNHLKDLSHERIAFMRGNPLSSDSKDRWDALCRVAAQIGLKMDPDLIVQIDTDDPTPMLGYPYAKQLLARKKPFTALFAYNDISAIGAIRAVQEVGLRVPQDISVMGFDDIQGAAFYTPSLTTVRQPLNRMGEVAAQTLLERIEGKKEDPAEIAIEPELVVRESTGKAPASA